MNFKESAPYLPRDAIARHGFCGHPFANDNSKPRRILIVSIVCPYRHKIPSRNRTRSASTHNVFLAPKPLISRKHALFRLRTFWRKADSTLFSPRSQYALTSGSFHARPEPMATISPSLAWLIRTFHTTRLCRLPKSVNNISLHEIVFHILCTSFPRYGL